VPLNANFRLIRFVWLIPILLIPGCNRQKSISDQGNSPLFIDETKLKPGEVIKPFAYIDPDKHDWRVEIRVSGEDLLDLGKRKMHSRKFSTDEPELLSRIREWEFKFGKKSTQRATSTFRVYRDNQLVDKHGLVLEKNASLGYQSTKYGLLEPINQEDMFELINEMSNF
jgi:hypothetical protein